MFSQYSWWDFINFVLILLVPYYGYVLIKYFREDIREWISNRGQPKAEPTAELSDEEEESLPSRFYVTDYSKGDGFDPDADSAQWLPAPSVSAQAPVRQSTLTSTGSDTDEIELQGPDVNTPSEVAFSLPVILAADNVSEQSIDVIISAAGRITADEEGVLVPIDADDLPAAKIAAAINNQQGRAAFSDFNFSR